MLLQLCRSQVGLSENQNGNGKSGCAKSNLSTARGKTNRSAHGHGNQDRPNHGETDESLVHLGQNQDGVAWVSPDGGRSKIEA